MREEVTIDLTKEDVELILDALKCLINFDITSNETEDEALNLIRYIKEESALQ